MVISDLLLHIMAHNRGEQSKWERVRMISYITAKFGNSDPKKFPSSVNQFMPFDWDEDSEPEDFKADYLRLRAAKKKLKHGS
jgi:hypothetical protein